MDARRSTFHRQAREIMPNELKTRNFFCVLLSVSDDLSVFALPLLPPPLEMLVKASYAIVDEVTTAFAI